MTPQTPQVDLDGRDHVTEQAAPATTITLVPTPTTPVPTTSMPRELTSAERHGLAMGWVAIAFGVLLLLGGLAMWAAVAFSAGFGGWLIAMGLLGLVMVAVVVAVAYTLRPTR